MVNYRHLGRSGLKISEITYGNWLTHGSQVENDAALACVRAALDAGISSFDTADVYANTVAEEVLAVGDIVVHFQSATGESRQPGHDAARAFVGIVAVDQRTGQDGAGVHHRVRGSSRAALELDGVDRLARRLYAAPVQGCAVGVGQSESEQERLDGRLDAERDIPIHRRSDRAVGQGQCDRA